MVDQVPAHAYALMNSSVLFPAFGSLDADSKNHNVDAVLNADAAIGHLDQGAAETGPRHRLKPSNVNRVNITGNILDIIPDKLDNAAQNESSLMSDPQISGITILEGTPGNATLDHNGNQVLFTEENVHRKNAQRNGSDVQISADLGFVEVSKYMDSDRKVTLTDSAEHELFAHEESLSRERSASQQQVLGVTRYGVDAMQTDEVTIQTDLMDVAMTSDSVATLPQATLQSWTLTKHEDPAINAKAPNVDQDVTTIGNGATPVEIVKEKNFEGRLAHVEGQGYRKGRNADSAERKGIFIGRAIRKRFGKKYFIGKIDSYDSDYNWYKVVYDDGDQEDLEETEVVALLLPEDYLSGVSMEKRKLLEGSINERKTKKYKRGGFTSGADNTLKIDLGSTQSIECSGHEHQVNDGNEETRDPKRPWTGIRRYLEKQETVGHSSIDEGLNEKIMAKEARALESCVHKYAPGDNPSSTCNNGGVADALVEALIRKSFRGRYYSGRVVKYDKETKYYMVEYEDGDSEELELQELKPILTLSLTPVTKRSNKMVDVQVGTHLIGAVVRKQIGKTYSIGNVVGFNGDAKMYMIKYEDGHEEVLEWSKLEQILVEKRKCQMEQTANDSVDEYGDDSTKINAGVRKYRQKQENLTIDENKTRVQTGSSLIGRCTMKTFGRKVYAGNVISYDKKRKLYKIKYEDGDLEELEWSELEPTLVQQQRQSSADLYGEYVFNESNSGRKARKRRSVQIESKDMKKSEDELKMGNCLIGSATRKKFGRKFYAGRVINYDKKTQFYRVQYEDGDEEDLEWSELVATLEKQLKANVVNEDKKGAALIGQSVRKKFSGKLYNGEVISYDNKTKFFKVKYEDDDQEDLEWDEVQHVLTANSKQSSVFNNELTGVKRKYSYPW